MNTLKQKRFKGEIERYLNQKHNQTTQMVRFPHNRFKSP